MSLRGCGALLLALALLAGVAGAADSARPVATPPPAPAILPPELQALEQKMEQLPVNSERYAVTTQATITVSVTKRGKHGKRTCQNKRVSLHARLVGAASISPRVGETFSGAHTSRPDLIQIGSTIYFFSAEAAREDGGRPWVRLGTAAASTGAVFPFHGDPSEVDAGGTGSYAGLINLLTTAEVEVRVLGAATVDGQQTTEFAAVVSPLRLIKGLPPKALADPLVRKLSERLEVFVTESGLPVRVVRSLGPSSQTITGTTDILAVNIPVDVKRPPRVRTISEAHYEKLPAGKVENSCSSSVRAIETHASEKSK